MRPGSALSAFLVAALVSLWAAPVDAARRAPTPCPPRGEATISEEGALVVYRPKIGPGSSPLPVGACLRGSSTRMALVTPQPPIHRPLQPRSGYLRLISTAAPVVAYVVGRLTGVDTSASELVVADVAHRTILRETPTGHSVDGGFVFAERPSALVVTAHGQVAWIEQRSGGAVRAPEAVVMAAPRAGPAMVLDEGSAVSPQSLYLSRGEVHWVDGSETRGAPLP